MIELRLKVMNEVGLHARPAAEFVKEANKYKADIKVRNATEASEWVNAKSILSILTLGVNQSHEIELLLDGEDEEQAANGLQSLVQGNFGEASS